MELYRSKRGSIKLVEDHSGGPGYTDALCYWKLRVGREKIKLCMAKMTGSAIHSIKQVALAKEEVNSSGKEEPFLLQAEMEEELADEVQISVTTTEMIGKTTMGVKTRLLLVPELIEACLLYTSRCV